jgi:3-oxoacyl-[acyl-carrier protein] reductase
MAEKVALITGGSRGIGKAIAIRLSEMGYAVVINFRQESAASAELVEKIKSENREAVAIQADLSDIADIDRLFQETMNFRGRLDVLINNSGVAEACPLEEIDEAHVERIFDLNVRALLFCTQRAVECFGEGGGNIVNLSSLAGQSNNPGTCVYSASKAAVDQLTRTLAMELGPSGIRVNAVAPGLIKTDMMRSVISDERQARVVNASAMRRLGEPEDVAEVVAFLVSDESSFMTGQIVVVDGGRPR